MKLFSLLVLAIGLCGTSCERHEFDGKEGTKQLHEKHGADHGEGHKEAAH